MNSKPGFFSSGRRAGLARHLGVALVLGLTLVAPEARAGVPLPVVAEVASVSSLAAVVKEIGISQCRSLWSRVNTACCLR